VSRHLAFLPRRADLTREAFRDYYETRHTPLALRHLRVFQKFLRNHVLAADPEPIPFDVISEFWFASAADREAVFDFLQGPDGPVIRSDEANFMGPERTAFEADEQILFGGPRIVDRAVVYKEAVLLRGRPGSDRDALHAACERYCEALMCEKARAMERLSLFLPVGTPAANRPADAVVMVWPAAERIALPRPDVAATGLAAVTHLSLVAHETPPEQLRD
jgi:uncharacterized protein (TIGR02118 family)